MDVMILSHVISASGTVYTSFIHFSYIMFIPTYDIGPEAVLKR